MTIVVPGPEPRSFSMLTARRWAEACARMAHDLCRDISNYAQDALAADYREAASYELWLGGSAKVEVWGPSDPSHDLWGGGPVVLCDPLHGYRWQSGESKRCLPATTPYSVLVAAIVADAPTEPDPAYEQEA